MKAKKNFKINISDVIKQELPDASHDVPLSEHTTYKIGGPADYFFVAKTNDQILSALKLAKKYGIPVLILGSGSNLLVSDKGFRGLVIKMANERYDLKDARENIIEAGAGISMDKLVEFSIQNSFGGLEWAGGLPGTLGGAVRGNAGAFGGETKDNIIEVLALDADFKLKKLSNRQCGFAYRTSVFKKKNWIVLSAVMKFSKGDRERLWEVAKSHMDYRREKQPLEYPNSGSVFQNCPLKNFSRKLQKELSGVVKTDPFPVVPTAYLLSEAGLKAAKKGGAEISTKHPNFMVNLGGAKAKDILALVDLAKKKVKKKFKVNLEVEVQLVGFDKK